MKARRWLVTGSATGFLAVSAGAFGAHGLRDTLSAKRLDNWNTASDYAIYHGLALLVVGLLAARAPSKACQVAGWSFAVGVALFSGSLWGLALTDISKLGIVTPFGGAAFLVGWVALGLATQRLRPAEGIA